MTSNNYDVPLVEAKVLWHCDYWDGPLSGVCLCDNRICWFLFDGDALADERIYYVYDLADEEVRSIVTSHFFFERYVGLHTCNHATLDGKRPIWAVRPQDQQSLFYGKYNRPELNLEERQPIGMFPSH